jgi:hypothetical protein
VAGKLPRASANKHRRGPSTPRHKALCCDRFAKRFAQDDGFAEGLKYEGFRSRLLVNSPLPVEFRKRKPELAAYLDKSNVSVPAFPLLMMMSSRPCDRRSANRMPRSGGADGAPESTSSEESSRVFPFSEWKRSTFSQMAGVNTRPALRNVLYHCNWRVTRWPL